MAAFAFIMKTSFFELHKQPTEVFCVKKVFLGDVYMRQNVPATAWSTECSVSWDDFYFRLHKKFRPSLQG